MRKEKHRKKNKVCFAETGLETVHEFPYSHIYCRKDFHCLKLPEINVHKYVPLAHRDPYARPARKKKTSLSDLFENDPLKLPFIGIQCTSGVDNSGNKSAPKHNPKLKVTSYAPIPKVNRDEKFQVGNTVHFRYSDFVVRKKDAAGRG